jgi:flagellar basal-body rod modification protein FlgD
MTSISSTGNAYLDSLNASASSSTAPAAAASATSSQTIDQSGFLKLLSAQLTTQDPTDPTDDNTMVQQMATFSEVAGITQMNQSLTAMSGSVQANRFGDASSWIGHAALVSSSVVAAASNGAYAGEIGLPADSKDVSLNLVDATGTTVYSKDLGAHGAGAVDWNWDGKDTKGNAVAGPLQMVVSATNSAGTAAITPTLSAWSQIVSVQSPTTGTTKLVTGLGTFDPSNVAAVS